MKHHRQLKARNVLFRITQAELDRLDRMAIKEDRSRSQLVRRLVVEWLERTDPPNLVVHGE